MMRVAGPVAAIAAMMSQAAYGDEVRHTKFSSALVGTWATTAESCKPDDKLAIVISEAAYSDSTGNCTVRWIVETAGAKGPNYAVHASCADPSQPAKTIEANMVIRPQSSDRISIGPGFDSLKTYQRCPPR